jgi:hypothetical protein
MTEWLASHPAEAFSLDFSGWIRRQNTLFREVAEQHPDCSHMLLLCGPRTWVPLDVSGNGDRLDVFELLEAAWLTPGQKLIDGPIVSFAGIGVADRHREELGKPLNGCWAGVGQD